MYGIKKSDDFTFLLNKHLLQICFGLFQVVLNFDGDISITVEGDWSFGQKTNGKGFEQNDKGIILRLLDQTIKTVQIIDKETLEIAFSNSESLKLYDSNPNGESFQITSPSNTIIV